MPSLFALVLAVSLAVPPPPVAPGTWTGEVVDVACYASTGVVGAANRACHMEVHPALATDLGQPVGLLTDDGTLLLLVASPLTPEAYPTLRAVVGHKATVHGRLWERGGMTVVGVEGVSL